MEKSIRKKFIISFWISSVFFIFTSLPLISFFFREILRNVVLGNLLVWVLSVFSYFLIRDSAYIERGTRYLFCSMGLQILVIVGFFIAFLQTSKRLLSHVTFSDGMFAVIFFLGMAALGYFLLNCYALWELNCVDKESRKEAITLLKNSRKNRWDFIGV